MVAGVDKTIGVGGTGDVEGSRRMSRAGATNAAGAAGMGDAGVDAPKP